LAEAALAFGPVEYFWLAVFGLSLIAALSQGDFLKGLIGACLGLLLSTVGVSETSAEVRFTLGSTTLIGGIEVVSALIGLYCVPVLIDLVATPERHLKAPERPRGFRLPEALAALGRNRFNVLRSSVIGTLVGALPGAGGSVAGLVAYSEARRSGRGEPAYGEGNPGGIVATESANNATVGGGFIPTLVLGIPGTPPDAVILGALLVQGVRTGPALFAEGGGVVYTFIFGLLLATVLMLPIGLLIGRFAYGAIVQAPKAALVPIVAFMTVIGSFAIRNNTADVAMMVALGALGWAMARRGFSVSPVVLGLILGSIAEQGFVQSWTIGDAIGDLWGQFFGRPLSLAIIAMIVVTFCYPFVPLVRARLAGQRPERGQRAPLAALTPDLVAYAGFAGVAGVVLWQTQSLNPEAAVFPATVALAMLGATLTAGGRALALRPTQTAPAPGSWLRRASVPAAMLAAALALPWLGFALTGLALALVLIMPALHARPSTRALAALIIGVALTVLAFVYGFREVLAVPLPMGRLW
ncbi:MAG: tripartite tricarboxylate transporter permease, partial [Pseudomonadota bacterium]